MYNAFWLQLFSKQSSFIREQNRARCILKSNTHKIQSMHDLHQQHNWKLHQYILKGLQAPQGTGI